MSVQQYLGSYRAAQIDMQRAERLIARINEQLDVQGVNTSSEKVQSSSSGDRTAKLIADLVDARNEFEDARDRALSAMREINAVIGMVTDPQQKRLLELRYIECKTWEEISGAMYISYRHVFNIHHKARDVVAQILGCEEE